MLLVDDLAAGGTKNLRHTPRGLVTLIINTKYGHRSLLQVIVVSQGVEVTGQLRLNGKIRHLRCCTLEDQSLALKRKLCANLLKSLN